MSNCASRRSLCASKSFPCANPRKWALASCERLVVLGNSDEFSERFLVPDYKNIQCPSRPMLCQTSFAWLSGGEGRFTAPMT